MQRLLYLITSLLLATAAQAQWVVQPFAFDAPDAKAAYIDAVDANTAWAMSSNLIAQSFDLQTNQIAVTTNGGQTWAVKKIAGIGAQETLTGLSAISGTTAWVCTHRIDSIGSQVLKTTDGGQNWVRQAKGVIFNEADSWPTVIHFFSATDGVVIGDVDGLSGGGLEIYYTSNGGTTWTRSANVPIGTSGEYATIYPPATVGNSIWFPNSEGDVFRSKDKGKTWEVAKGISTIGGRISSIAFRDERNGLAVVASIFDTDHKLYSSADGGITWTALPYTGPLHSWGLVRVPDNGNYLSVGQDLENGDQGSSYSQDNGRTWIKIESEINHLFVDAASPTAVWSGSISDTGAGANKLTSTVLGSRSATLVLGASLSPNPSANGQFRVQWPAATHAGPATLTVFDAVGRQVLRRTLDASRSTETTLDLRGQQAGLYQVKLESGSGVSQLRAQVL